MGKIEAKNIVKYFQHDGKPLKAIGGVNLTVNDGEFVCIVGPSGCGKSTFLRILAGLEKPDDGEILLDGKKLVNSFELGKKILSLPISEEHSEKEILHISKKIKQFFRD